jgi:hypothetical protein
MKGLENFSDMVASMASKAGVGAFVGSAKVRSLFQKRAGRPPMSISLNKMRMESRSRSRRKNADHA